MYGAPMLYFVLLPGSVHPSWRWRILIGKIYGEFHFTPDDDIETFHGFTQIEMYIAQQIRGLIYPLEVVIENPTNLYSETVTTEADPHYVQNTIRVQQGS